ncbi:MAG: hypothetical protein UW41_C0037G0012, partial [Candidatus Collierbacteria bacterium GW2011_GWC2_44_18]
PYYLLSPQQQKVIETLRILLPGDPERSKMIQANNDWIQNYYVKRDAFYTWLQASGKFAGFMEDNGAPKQTPELKGLINQYFALPNGTGEKTRFMAKHPELQEYFTANAAFKNSQRMELGLSLLPTYDGYGSGGKKPRGAVKSFGGAPKLKASSFKAPKVSAINVKPLSTPKLEVKTPKFTGSAYEQAIDDFMRSKISVSQFSKVPLPGEGSKAGNKRF